MTINIYNVTILHLRGGKPSVEEMLIGIVGELKKQKKAIQDLERKMMQGQLPLAEIIGPAVGNGPAAKDEGFMPIDSGNTGKGDEK